MAWWSDLSDDELAARLAAALPESTTDQGARRITAMVHSRDDEDVAAIISSVLADDA